MPDAFWAHTLPAINACFNGLSTVLLVLGYAAIRRGRIVWHKRAMLSAFASSALFLLGYLARMANTGTHRFVGPRAWRWFYLALLGSHMVLAVAVLPLILLALYRAYRAEFGRHKQVARWAWPIWLYVSVTGVLVYGMLYWLVPALAAHACVGLQSLDSAWRAA